MSTDAVTKKEKKKKTQKEKTPPHSVTTAEAQPPGSERRDPGFCSPGPRPAEQLPRRVPAVPLAHANCFDYGHLLNTEFQVLPVGHQKFTELTPCQEQQAQKAKRLPRAPCFC